MIRITHEHGIIEAKGHAESKIVCAMYTAMTVALLQNLNSRLGLNLDFKLEDGFFRLDTKGTDIAGGVLVDSYLYAIQQLAISYPKSFDIEFS